MHSIYVKSLACIKVKSVESEYFKIDIGVRRGCRRSPLVFNVYWDSVMKEAKMKVGRLGVSVDCQDSCMRMTWLCAVNGNRTESNVRAFR